MPHERSPAIPDRISVRENLSSYFVYSMTFSDRRTSRVARDLRRILEICLVSSRRNAHARSRASTNVVREQSAPNARRGKYLVKYFLDQFEKNSQIIRGSSQRRRRHVPVDHGLGPETSSSRIQRSSYRDDCTQVHFRPIRCWTALRRSVPGPVSRDTLPPHFSTIWPPSGSSGIGSNRPFRP